MAQAFDQEKAMQFWERHLSGLDASVFPPLSSHLATPKADAKMEHYMSWPSSAQHRWSYATSLFRGALWSRDRPSVHVRGTATNGKVDRKELARRARTATEKKLQRLASAPACPNSDIEVALCEEATATFGMQVGISDGFFKLGGHSLLATKLICRVGDRLKARLTVKDVFDHPIFSELAVVIREGLQNAVPVTLNGSGNAKQGSAGVAPRNEMETMLCKEFANVLGMDVGVTDNFFDLGGHSLMATKLAARIGRRLNTTISVKEVFEHPIVFQLAKTLELAQSESDRGKHATLAEYTAFQLLSMKDSQGFIQNEIGPQLRFAHGGIQDVYPATHMQKAFLCDASTGHPKPLVPFYIDFPPDSDCATLVEACSSLVKRFDMFRTVVVEAAGELYQVVLEHFDLTIDDFRGACPSRAPLIRFTVLKQASSVRVLLCLSHALYDGLSLEHVVRDLHMLYKGRSLLPATQFSRYMQYMDHTRKAGCDFWRDVIKDTPITVLGDVGAGDGGRELEVGAARTLHATKIIDIPLQAVRSSSSITQATVFNAACAVVLSRETGAQDVVFGRIVSGRQGLPVSWQNIVGPCTNAVPASARIDNDESDDDDHNHRQMPRDMQDQYLLSLPFETLDFDEVRRSCTNWPATANNYACCVTYHDFSYHPESEMEQQRVEMGVLARKDALLKEEPVYDLGIAGEVEPDGVHLQVTVVAKTRLFSKERAAYLMDEVCRKLESLNSAL
ncbi:BEAS beauvericin nonribosomal cyclodepsipeptide synthetase [Beauveria brongniartii RCEF 3172]|uniref:BEAS beauvericin nonribosomal cyclodepsipeptide synthetase n=1 Tax=Beauveria brongniartii RCEF 3172 TaxID=1081107 RepID=A0A166YWD9_9HYPO|nr:BEAS beauvericin nonribosomal cyclodepsipeptide synthetase [Beauveria brongniartii RCEF 3172]